MPPLRPSFSLYWHTWPERWCQTKPVVLRFGPALLFALFAVFAFSHGRPQSLLLWTVVGLTLLLAMFASQMVYLAMSRLEVAGDDLVRKGFPFPRKRCDAALIAQVIECTLEIGVGGLTASAWLFQDRSGKGLFWLNSQFWDIGTIEHLATKLSIPIAHRPEQRMALRQEATGKSLPRW